MSANPLSSRFFRVATLLGATGCVGLARAATFSEADVAAFTDRHCSTCHNDVDKEGGLDLTTLKYDPSDLGNFLTWVKIHDRVQAGEMPPKEKKRPAPTDVAAFVKNVASSLTGFEQETVSREGRSTQRRLNRSEYENALRDLFQAPWLQVQGLLPADGEAYRYNKVSEALDVSFVHMARYMSAAEYAMRDAMSIQANRPPTTTKRYYARDDASLAGRSRFTEYYGGNHYPDRSTFPVLGTQAQPEVRAMRAPLTVGDADPEMREQEAVAWVHSNYVTGFGSGWSNFVTAATGRYRIRFNGYTVWSGPGGYKMRFSSEDRFGQPEAAKWHQPNHDDISPGRRPEPITVYSRGPLMNRRLGAFDLMTEPTVTEMDVLLLANETIVTDASRFFRSRPTVIKGMWTNPLAQRDGIPGVAFRWMEVEGPLYDESTGAGYRVLFGDLPVRKVEQAAGAAPVAPARGRGGRGRGNVAAAVVPLEVISTQPKQDSERLLRSFMQRAYRRPVDEADVRRYLPLFSEHFEKLGFGFADSMIATYTAVLASPGFVFIDEKPGRLDDYSLATRLAFFLWNSEPDEVLRGLAAEGELHRPEILRAQAERLLSDEKSRRFVEAFLDYWLDIRKMEDTTPDTTLYNDYYLDDALAEAALEETRLFFGELLHRNMPARNIVDSDFTFLNERLAVHYGIEGVNSALMHRVAIPSDSPRGGLMTQASVLKVTANGTTTSPVIRGLWIMERIVGQQTPPPPAAVPAVEPDIRGAATIREQLAKHRADESCAVCHAKIDPAGFALESFDVMGGWRDRYRAVAIDKSPEMGIGKNGHPFQFHFAQSVDASGELADGRAFRDVNDFKRLLLVDEAKIARNLAQQLVVYATGAPVRFSDRQKIEQILQGAKTSHYGVRDLVAEIVQSELFLNK